jgi:hypothetical protein
MDSHKLKLWNPPPSAGEALPDTIGHGRISKAARLAVARPGAGRGREYLSRGDLDANTYIQDVDRCPEVMGMEPIVLTGDEAAAIATAAKPLSRDQRDAFIKAVIASLVTAPERGPGVVHRIIREAQRQYIDPPNAA